MYHEGQFTIAFYLTLKKKKLSGREISNLHPRYYDLGISFHSGWLSPGILLKQTSVYRYLAIRCPFWHSSVVLRLSLKVITFYFSGAIRDLIWAGIALNPRPFLVHKLSTLETFLGVLRMIRLICIPGQIFLVHWFPLTQTLELYLCECQHLSFYQETFWGAVKQRIFLSRN